MLSSARSQTQEASEERTCPLIRDGVQRNRHNALEEVGAAFPLFRFVALERLVLGKVVSNRRLEHFALEEVDLCECLRQPFKINYSKTHLIKEDNEGRALEPARAYYRLEEHELGV